jgi:hypothetical protein
MKRALGLTENGSGQALIMHQPAEWGSGQIPTGFA